MHPQITAQINAVRHAELIAEADHARLVGAARRTRSNARARSRIRLGRPLVAAH